MIPYARELAADILDVTYLPLEMLIIAQPVDLGSFSPAVFPKVIPVQRLFIVQH